MADLVSVIVPVYNAEQTIGETIASVLAQTHSEWELVLVDDGSRDQSLARMREHADPRIRIFSQPNKGVSAARNHGIAECRGKYVAFLDADDIWDPRKLEKSLEALGGGAGLCYTDLRAFSHSIAESVPFKYQEPIREANDYHRLLIYDYVPTLSVVVRKEALDAAGRFDENLHGTEDWDLWIRIAKLAAVAYIPEALTYYRFSRNSLSNSSRDRHLQEERKVLDKHFGPGNALPAHVRKRAYWVWHKKVFINHLSHRRILQALRTYGSMFLLWPSRTLDLSFLLKHSRIPSVLKSPVPSGPDAAPQPFMGVKLHDFTIPALVETIAATAPAAKGRPFVVGNINVHALNLTFADLEFRRIMNTHDYVFCDGYGILWGARMLGLRLRQRMTPPDWVDHMFAKPGLTYFFIGDSEQVVAAFRARIESSFPGIRILGHQNGFFDHFGSQGSALVSRLNELRPDVILVGMGMPLQEKWIDRFLPDLAGGIYVPVGALFRWYVGAEKRAPKWVTDNGLEWLARLISNPRHVWRRYVIGNPLYLLRLGTELLRQRVVGSGGGRGRPS